MNHQIEQLENSMVKITLEISPEQFEQAMETAYKRSKKSDQLAGIP